jgi:choline dehydrogenase-like flavoprotein
VIVELAHVRDPLAAVVVVGAGAAGLTLAHALGDRGVDVLVVESGGLEPSDELQRVLNGAESVGQPHAGLEAGRVRALGGTTTVWPGQSMRLRRADLEQWPLAPEELDGYYARAESLLGVGPPRRAEELWRTARLRPLQPSGPGLDYVASAYARPRDLGRRFRPDLERRPNVRVLLGATAVRLALADGGERVAEIVVGDLEGRSATVRGDRIVLAAGGIENARLLLASGVGPPAVGRHFHDHPALRAGIVHTDHPQALADRFGTFVRRVGQGHVKLALSAAEERARGVPACSASFVFDFGDDHPAAALMRLRRRALRRRPRQGALRDLGLVARRPGTLASTVPRRLLRGLGPPVGDAAAELLCIAEQRPESESRMTLGADRDPLGVPRVLLDWRVGEEVRAAAVATVELVDAWLRSTGLGSVAPAPWLAGDDWRDHVSDTFHHMGATRMAARPDDGVVDGNCRVHGIENLYVAGSSVFPSAGYANPTLTIVAQALRLADHLAAER